MNFLGFGSGRSELVVEEGTVFNSVCLLPRVFNLLDFGGVASRSEVLVFAFWCFSFCIF